MSAGKFTAGPWKRQSRAGVNRFRIVDARGHQVADANHFNLDAEANADVLAAAPDLLAAAQAAWNCVIELPPSQARVELAQMLQAAIEKAGAQC